MKLFVQKYSNIIKLLILVALSYLTGVSLAMVSGYRVTQIEIMIPLLIIFSGIVYHKAAEVFEAKEIKYAVPLGFLFALTVVVGSKIVIEDGVFSDMGIMDLVIFPFLGLFFSALILLLFYYSDVARENALARKKKDFIAQSDNGFVRFVKDHPFVSLWILYVICYLPYYLTFFPGNCGNDTWKSLRMILGQEPWSNHHPVLFTGLIMIVRKLTGFLPLSGSVGVFSFLQMLILAAALAHLSLRIIRTKTHILCKLFAVAMFALHPFMGMYSVYLTKDVLFSVIMLLLSLKLYDVIAGKGELLAKPAECAKLSLLFLLASAFRNNGMYIAIVMAVIFLVLYKQYRKQVLVLFVFAIGLFQIWQGPVFKAMGIEKQSFAEAASVPLQQVGYVLWEDGSFSEEDTAFLEQLMPIDKVKEVYQPGFTDPYKFNEAFNDDFLNDHIGDFMGVWWNGCKNHFGSYVKAYLMQTVGYWHYGETNSVCTQGCTENTLGVEQIDVIGKLTGISLEPLFEQMVLAGRKAPILCVIASMAMQMMMVFLLIVQYVRRKNAGLAIWLIPLVILWGTIMIAAPASCLLRYLFPIFLLWPLLIAEFFSEEPMHVDF